MIYSVKEKIKASDFVKAEEIIKEFEKTGQFDVAINKVISLIQQEREPLEKINRFNTLVTIQAEKYLIDYDIENDDIPLFIKLGTKIDPLTIRKVVLSFRVP